MEARRKVAQRYRYGLHNVVKTAVMPEGSRSAWAQYAIETPHRDALKAHLQAQGIPTAIYYPKPLHRLEAYKNYPVADNGIPVTDQLSEEVISLPMHAYLDEATQERIVAGVREALA